MEDTTHPHLTRQLELIPLAVLQTPIHVIGAGAIGSCTVLALAKMGFDNISVWDDDSIEVENMNSQFYRYSDIGSPKVDSLQDIVESFTGVLIETNLKKYDGMLPLSGIVISAVDSMQARKMIWDAHKKVSPGTKLIIDPRMGAETGLTYAMCPMQATDIAAYENTLYSDENSAHERCTAKATMYTALMLSGHVAKIVKDFVCGVAYSRVTQWSIAANEFEAYPSKKKEN